MGYGENEQRGKGRPTPLLPLAGALFRSNKSMVEYIYNRYEELFDDNEMQEAWSPRKVRWAISESLPPSSALLLELRDRGDM